MGQTLEKNTVFEIISSFKLAMKCVIESPSFELVYRLLKRESANSAKTYKEPFNTREEREVTESGLIAGKGPQEQVCSTGAAEKDIWEKRQDSESICCALPPSSTHLCPSPL